MKMVTAPVIEAGCSPAGSDLFPEAGIHLREKNIVGPTEKSEDANASSKFAGQDRRFSMKMMTAPVIDTGCSRQNYYKCCGNFKFWLNG